MKKKLLLICTALWLLQGLASFAQASVVTPALALRYSTDEDKKGFVGSKYTLLEVEPISGEVIRRTPIRRDLNWPFFISSNEAVLCEHFTFFGYVGKDLYRYTLGKSDTHWFFAVNGMFPEIIAAWKDRIFIQVDRYFSQTSTIGASACLVYQKENNEYRLEQVLDLGQGQERRPGERSAWFDPIRGKLYLGVENYYSSPDQGHDYLAVVDCESATIESYFDFGSQPRGCAAIAVCNGKLYLCPIYKSKADQKKGTGADSVFVYDLATMRLIKTIRTGDIIRKLEYSAADNKLFGVMDGRPEQLAVIDCSSDRLIAKVPMPDAAVNEISYAGVHRLMVAMQYGGGDECGLYLFDTQTNRFVKKIEGNFITVSRNFSLNYQK